MSAWVEIWGMQNYLMCNVDTKVFVLQSGCCELLSCNLQDTMFSNGILTQHAMGMKTSCTVGGGGGGMTEI